MQKEQTANGARAKQTIMGRIPLCVWAYFASLGVEKDDVLLAFRSDMTADGYGDSFLLLTEREVLCAEGSVVFKGERTAGEYRRKKRRTEYFSETSLRRFAVADLEDPKVELPVSVGQAVAKVHGEDTLLCCFTATYSHDATVFCRAVKELQTEGFLSERLLREESEEFKICPRCHRRFPDRGRRFCPNCIESIGLAARLGKMFVKYKKYIIVIFITLLFNIGLGLLMPYLSNSVLYGDVLQAGGKYFGKIAMLVGVLAGVRVLSALVSLATNAINAMVAAEVTYDLRVDIFSSISRLSLRSFGNRQTGSMMTQISNDSTTIYWFFCDGFPQLALQVLQLLIMLGVMFRLNVELTLYTIITIPLFFVSFKLIERLLSKHYARTWSKRASFNSLISDVINGIRVVKAFSREDAEVKRFGDRSEAVAEADKQLVYTSSRIYPFLQYALSIGTYVVWWIGGWRVMGNDGMDFPMLITFTAYLALVYSPIEMLSDVSSWWADCMICLKRLFDIKDARVEVTEAPDAIDHELKGDLEFKNVSFSYVENRKVLTDVSFHVQAGKTLGIVGQTGAGKSTIANLITRLYDCDEGAVLIDGIDVRKLSLDCLRRNISIVSQETYLFTGTILENIRYARPDATREEVLAAAKAAHAHDFIIRLPDGYETRIGQGDRQLSGGERQRISIARSLLKNPTILILDEATSAMDTQTERNIQQALTELSRTRTTVIIAHRLSTLRDADSLIAIEHGKLMETGTASELMEKKGVYYKLYQLQLDALKNIGIPLEDAPDGPKGPPKGKP